MDIKDSFSESSVTLVHSIRCNLVSTLIIHKVTKPESIARFKYVYSYLEEMEGMRREGWRTWQVVTVCVGEV